jgi:hypothetical protein
VLIAIGVFLLLVWSVLFLVLHVAAAGVHLLLIIGLVAFGIRLFSPGRRAF